MKKVYFFAIAFLIISIVSGCSNKSSVSNKTTHNTFSEKSNLNKQTNSTPTENNVLNKSTNQKQSSYSSLSMVNEITGWILKDNKLLRTVDGGNSWKDVSPCSFDINDKYSMGKCFYNDNTAWISLGSNGKLAVYNTTDGGSHWDKTLLPTTENWEYPGGQSISFINLMDGYILVDSDPALGTMYKAIYKTNDGGKSWKRISNISENIASYPTGMKFKNMEEGWITSSNHGQDYILTFRTNDYGINWSKENIQIPSIYKDGYYTNSYPPTFFDKDTENGVIPIEYVSSTAERFIIPYVTTDGGNTWSITNDLSTYIFDCYDFLDEKQWWAIDKKDNKLYKTNDSGKTWEEISQSESFKNIESINFVTEKVGWAMGNNIFIKTIDGGKTWSNLDF